MTELQEPEMTPGEIAFMDQMINAAGRKARRRHNIKGAIRPIER